MKFKEYINEVTVQAVDEKIQVQVKKDIEILKKIKNRWKSHTFSAKIDRFTEDGQQNSQWDHVFKFEGKVSYETQELILLLDEYLRFPQKYK